MAPVMGMPKMDIVDVLNTIFGKPNCLIGWIMHFLMGLFFSLIYARLWSISIGNAICKSRSSAYPSSL